MDSNTSSGVVIPSGAFIRPPRLSVIIHTCMDFLLHSIFEAPTKINSRNSLGISKTSYRPSGPFIFYMEVETKRNHVQISYSIDSKGPWKTLNQGIRIAPGSLGPSVVWSRRVCGRWRPDYSNGAKPQKITLAS